MVLGKLFSCGEKKWGNYKSWISAVADVTAELLHDLLGDRGFRRAVSSWRCLESGVCVNIAAASLGGLLACWPGQNKRDTRL